MKSDMAHMTAVSTSSHRNPRCILRELRQASEGGLTEALRESDGAGRKPQLPKKVRQTLPPPRCMRAYALVSDSAMLMSTSTHFDTTARATADGPQKGQNTREPLR